MGGIIYDQIEVFADFGGDRDSVADESRLNLRAPIEKSRERMILIEPNAAISRSQI
jgi:hypothetical protein